MALYWNTFKNWVVHWTQTTAVNKNRSPLQAAKSIAGIAQEMELLIKIWFKVLLE